MHRARIAITQLLLGDAGEEEEAHGTWLFSSRGLSASENVLTPRQHMLAQQYRGGAAVLQRLRRLEIKHTITCMEPRGDSVSEGCGGARRPPGYPLFVYAGVIWRAPGQWDFSIIAANRWRERREGGKGGLNMWPGTARPLARGESERE